MKIHILYTLIILILLAVMWRSCGNSEKPNTHIQTIQAEVDTLGILAMKATKSFTTAAEIKWKWHKTKYDTIHDSIPVPYLQIIHHADTVIAAQDSAYNDLCNELNQCYEVNAKTWRYHKTVVDSLSKRCKKRYWRGFRDGFIGGVIVGEGEATMRR